MTRHLAAFCLSAAAACAQSGITAPRAGCVLDRDGSLRPLYGASATFIPGSVTRTNVIAAACSAKLAILKTSDAVEVRDASMQPLGRWTTPSGGAYIAFTPGGGSAYVYFPRVRELRFLDSAHTLRTLATPDAFDGSVLAIAAPDDQHLTAVLRTDDRVHAVRIAVATGTVEEDLPIEGAGSPLLLLPGGTLLYADGAALVLRRPNRAEQRFALPAPALRLDLMGDGLVQIPLATRTAPAALRLTEGREQLLRIPEAAQ